jgi:hypothetical protein
MRYGSIPEAHKTEYSESPHKMKSSKKKASAKSSVRFRDLETKKNPKGGGSLKIDATSAGWIKIT